MLRPYGVIVAMIMLVLVLVLLPLPASAARVTETRGSFEFSYPEAMRESLNGLLDSAETTRRRIAADLGTEGPARIEVRVAGSLDEFALLQPSGVRLPIWAVGVAYPRSNLMVLNHGRTAAGTIAETEQVFAHELSHLMLSHAVGFRRVPRWFDEGLAVREAGEWSYWSSRGLIAPALSDNLIPLRRLSSSFPGERGSAHLAYAQSVEFVSFLLEEYGQERFQRLLAMLRGGQPFFESLQEVTGHRVRDLEKQWASHLKMRFSWLPLLTSTSVVWFLGAVVFLAAYVRRRGQKKTKLQAMAVEEEALERVIAAADEAEQRAIDDEGPPPGTLLH